MSKGSQLNGENLGRFAFVPLFGQHGWKGPAVSGTASVLFCEARD